MHWRVQIDIAKMGESRLFPRRMAAKGSHRRYDIEDIRQAFYKNDSHEMRKKVVGYARVSGRDQADDLKRQKLRLEKECCKHSDDFEIISDPGSGINYNKKGLKRLLSMILAGQISEVILTHRDRLLRFGSQLLLNICEYFDVKIRVLDDTVHTGFEKQLAVDLIEIITVFTHLRMAMVSL